jgi:hypothetical protein
MEGMSMALKPTSGRSSAVVCQHPHCTFDAMHIGYKNRTPRREEKNGNLRCRCGQVCPWSCATLSGRVGILGA